MIHGTAGIAIDIIDCGSVHLHARHFPTQKRNGETKEFLWEDPLLFNTCIAEMNELQAPKKKVSWTRFFSVIIRLSVWFWHGYFCSHHDGDHEQVMMLITMTMTTMMMIIIMMMVMIKMVGADHSAF